MQLTRDVEFIISRLEEQGYRADVVGGPVRDFLRGHTPSDYDITTSALPDEIKAAFSDMRTVDTGIKHGTVTLILGGAGYEITTYRIDGEYRDSRHPESVSFTSDIEEDLARRDFTMNAIAYSHRFGITDPFFGREDIKSKIIRAVGDPNKRFSEDALRILRALRFASCLGFSIEKQTKEAVFSKAHLLKNISAERIYSEWIKLLSGERAYEVITEYRDVISVFLPELSELRMPSAHAFSAAEVDVRQMSLFYLSCGEECADKFALAMRRLKTDSDTRRLGERVLSCVGKFERSTSAQIGRMLMDIGVSYAKKVVALEETLGIGDGDGINKIDEYISSGEPYLLSHLAIGGDELREIGFSGADIGEALSYLLLQTVEKKIKNDERELLARAMELFRHKTQKK